MSSPSATVVGAGVFGAWIAHALRHRGWNVTLVEQHGPANSRASSGGETRIIRSGYGSSAVYARWARESLPEWLELERRTSEQLFVKTGALFVGRAGQWLDDTERTLHNQDIRCERLQPQDLRARFPQLTFPAASGIFEPDAGVLFARRAVQRLVAALVNEGVTLITGRITGVSDPLVVGSDAVIFACGPWLPTLFPELLVGDDRADETGGLSSSVRLQRTLPYAASSCLRGSRSTRASTACRIWSIVASRSRSMHTGRRPIPSRSIAPSSAEAIAAVREILKRRLPAVGQCSAARVSRVPVREYA